MPFDPNDLYSAFIITCDRVLRETSDVTSIIRIVDLHEVSVMPANGVLIPIQALTVMKSRKQTKDHLFTMEVVFPDGSDKPVQVAEDGKPLHVSFGSRSPELNPLFGAQVLIQMSLLAPIPGTYYLRVMLDGQKIAETGITLRVRQNS